MPDVTYNNPLYVCVCFFFVDECIFFVDNEYVKEKRAGVLRLFPFPRVGRSDPGEAAAMAASNFDHNSLTMGGGPAGSNANDNMNAGGFSGSFEDYDTGEK